RRMHSMENWLLRLPQEDFCQAKGLPPSMKYDADGGPGVLDVVQILQQSVTAKQDLETFFCAQVIFWALGATDGHAKNFSLHIEPRGRYRLTPLYDILSIWPHEGPKPSQINGHKAKLAMGIPSRNKHFKLQEIQRRHFHAFGKRLGLDVDANELVHSLIRRTPLVVEAVAKSLPPDFPASVSEPILNGLYKNLFEKLSRMPEA
ncbi:HipA domain-containing protein, partial [Nostoc sp. CHAB 5834]|nr:HipA domain-containing protein [Nostoc sp. CHAB 5834]